MTKCIKDAAQQWPPIGWGTNDPYATGLEPDATAIIISATKIDGYVHLTVVQNNRRFFNDFLPLAPDDLDAMVTALDDAARSDFSNAYESVKPYGGRVLG